MTTVLHPKIQIGNIVRNAIIFNFRRANSLTMSTDKLLSTVSDLFRLLDERKVNYVLVGGIAILQYVEGRNTEDIDLIVALSDIKKLPEVLISSSDNYFARGEYKGLQIDFLLTQNRLFETVRRKHTVMHSFVENDIRTATVEGLLLLKLYALPSLYRQGNFARVSLYETDIASLLQRFHTPLKPIYDELSHHLNETDLTSVKEVMVDIEQRIKRFGDASKSG